MRSKKLLLTVSLLTTFIYANSLSLISGWNLVGANCSLTIEELKTKVGSDNLLVVQGQNKTYQKSYVDEGKDFLNNFIGFEEGRGYWIKVDTNVNVEYSKTTHSGEKSIQLERGWNIINPPSDMNLSSVKAQLGETLEVIQGQTKTYQKEYVDNGQNFLNNFTAFEEPKGYWIKVSKGGSLTFLTGRTNFALAEQEPYYKYAWHIKSADTALVDKGYTVNQNADINLTEAWKMTMGAGVKVAVIDDGADVEHEDLKSNIFVAYNADDNNSDVKNYSDDPSHGNSCAGLIVAPINGKGTVGVAPEAKLIAIKQNEQSDAKAIVAFEYAKNQGAKVISCSWGSEDVSEMLVAELKSLYDAGITVLFASGNDGNSLDLEGINDESEVEWVVGVGASTELNDVGSYSNYGSKLEFIAPGGDRVESSGILSIDDMGELGSGNTNELVNDNYAFMDGTSFATPVSAGVVALMYAVNPNLTPAQVRHILTTTATKVGDEPYNASGFNEKRAYGKINAGKAVAEAKRLMK